MKVNITIGEWAAKHTKTGEYALDVNAGATVGDVIALIGLSPDETGLCAVNDKNVTRGHVLGEGDSLKFFPCIVGG